MAWGIPLLVLLLVGASGYLAYENRRFRRATLTISRAVGKTQSELGIRKTMEAILAAIADLFSARRVVLALTESKGRRSFLWETRGSDAGRPSKVEFSQLPASEAQKYFLSGLGRGWSAVQLRRSAGSEPFHCLVLDEAGKRICNVPSARLEKFPVLNDFRSLLGVALSFGKWTGRLLVFDPSGTTAGESELRFLQALIWDVGPAVHSQYLLAHLRSRVRKAERARVARELHDGVVQSLVAVEMRLAALQRTTLTDPGQVIEAVAQAQQDVRRQMLAVRELMEQIKPIELSPKELLACLAEIVDRFRRETAISASFVSEFEQVTLAPHVCSELVRIAQEALFNIRKHSLANNVRVLLARAEGHCKLVIEDDGRGFEFSGRFSDAQLEAIRKGPRVIKERVRSIGGELVIDSMPGHGARLEISIPQNVYG
jgi:signal transduction histidine kinase